MTSSPTPVLRRPRNGRVIAGVCAGLADRFALSRTFVRLAFLLSILLPGPQVIIYVVLWIVIPSAALPVRVVAPARPPAD